MRYTASLDILVYEYRNEDESETKYGYITMRKDGSSNTFSCAYAVHTMKFKMQLRNVEVRTPKYFLGIQCLISK